MKKPGAIFYLGLLLSVIAVAGLVLVLAPGNADTPPVIFSTPAPSAEAESAHEGDLSSAIAVTPETVQTVIATLSRVSDYSRSLSVRDFWSDGERSRVLSVAAKGDALRVETVQTDRPTEYLLLRGDSQWLWYSDDSRVWSGEAVSADRDACQSIISYEKVLDLPVSHISDAGYAEFGGSYCLYVRFRSGSMGYVSECYIDIATGLLMGERCYDGENLIYSMDSDIPELAPPEDSLFAPPGSK